MLIRLSGVGVESPAGWKLGDSFYYYWSLDGDESPAGWKLRDSFFIIIGV